MFRVLTLSETETAHQILCDASAWLLSRGIQQWTVPYPLELYRARTVRAENYGLFMGGDLAVVVSLLGEWPVYWADALAPAEPFLWVATLASALRFKGQSLGSVMLDCIDAEAQQNGIAALYLDCQIGEGVLPRFYESAGFVGIARKDLTWGGRTAGMLLMKKPVPIR